ncbi:hypothetical protein VV02_05870 [Luteipulveratus mongoliensis]|uniref:Uncharacterized protein n=2 Tax=Luteipulveratus mongoliensis TaxID=571913 RepID=A0A0K1JFK1_9MICO|nr:hypothetical protein VV02_05870 [Luteipulveratus mongoliensis]
MENPFSEAHHNHAASFIPTYLGDRYSLVVPGEDLIRNLSATPDGRLFVAATGQVSLVRWAERIGWMLVARGYRDSAGRLTVTFQAPDPAGEPTLYLELESHVSVVRSVHACRMRLSSASGPGARVSETLEDPTDEEIVVWIMRMHHFG